MDGDLTLEKGDLLSLLMRANARMKEKALAEEAPSKLRHWWTTRIAQANARRAAKRNVAHHYDLSVAFYRLFLDPDMQYSCAYFSRPGMSLEEAQIAKKRHIAAKLRLFPAARVLDIGCGWGGLGLTLARDYNASVQGITLSEQQLAHANLRAEAEGLDEEAHFHLMDYRDVMGSFDRIVSVGMFEHVGINNYDAYFSAVRRLLNDRGVALIHTIGRLGPAAAPHPFLQKYIFPGGYIPSLSDMAPAIERSGLVLCDLEVLRLHYADTCAAWLANFTQNRQIVAEMYDERFCRMWEFYLAGCEAGFRSGDLAVFQFQLSRQKNGAPLTRDYIAESERAAAERARESA
jgi:cyclopropane-fatty-acyl-phospholipid synthase